MHVHGHGDMRFAVDTYKANPNTFLDDQGASGTTWEDLRQPGTTWDDLGRPRQIRFRRQGHTGRSQLQKSQDAAVETGLDPTNKEHNRF